jgi:hypothetical protein
LAEIIVIGIWIVSVGGTIALGIKSSIYLMPAGVFCFFQWDSAVILFWLVPWLFVAICTLVLGFVGLVCVGVKSHSAIHRQENSQRSACIYGWGLSIRAFLFVGILMVGWIPCAIAAFLQYTQGHTSEALIVLIGVCGTLHSVLVPLAFIRTSDIRDRISNTQVRQRHLFVSISAGGNCGVAIQRDVRTKSK